MGYDHCRLTALSGSREPETRRPNPPRPSATPPRRGENGEVALLPLPLLGGVPRSGEVGMLTAGWIGVAGRREG